MAKIFQVPVNHEYIRNINPAQMFFYSSMINEDRKKDFEEKRDYIEYLASFINGKAVQDIKTARDNPSAQISDEDFEKQIRGTFGRDIDFNKKQVSKTAVGEDQAKSFMKPKINKAKKKSGIQLDEIKNYLGMDLDEVKYIPNK